MYQGSTDYINDDEMNVYSSKRSAPEMKKVKVFESDLINNDSEVSIPEKLQENIEELLCLNKFVVPSVKTANL